MTITVLGSGSSKPIPRNDRCPQCSSRDKRDKRWPSAVLIGSHFLIDAPPMIDELLRSVNSSPEQVTHVVFSHRHQDASGGLKFLNHAKGRAPAGYKIKTFTVPHGRGSSKGFNINGKLLISTDFSNIKPLTRHLKRRQVVLLDGSGWQRTFPSHQPMIKTIPIIKQYKNLKAIYFTHTGHTHIPHRQLEQKIRELGDHRFHLAHHGMNIDV